MPQPQQLTTADARRARVEALLGAIMNDEEDHDVPSDDGKYVLEVRDHVLRVREPATKALVAYSAMRSDFEQSLGEFLHDYVVG